MIIYLTLQFIMAHFVESISGELHQETQIVNATASEFMELMIRAVSQVGPDYCMEIMHMVIKPLCSNLRTAIDNQNDAQQVILLNLLKVILFEHESLFYKSRSRDEAHNHFYFQAARNLFENENFFQCFTLGLKNEVAFVRYHYI